MSGLCDNQRVLLFITVPIDTEPMAADVQVCQFQKQKPYICMCVWLPLHVTMFIFPTLGMHVRFGVKSIMAASTNERKIHNTYL